MLLEQILTYFLVITMIVVIVSDLWRYIIPDTVHVVLFGAFVSYLIYLYPDSVLTILFVYGGIVVFIAIMWIYLSDEENPPATLVEIIFYVILLGYFGTIYYLDNSSFIWNPVFVMLGFLLFGFVSALLGQMAGGDVKLLSVLGLWLGYRIEVIVNFIIFMSFFGIVLIAMLLVVRQMTASVKNKEVLKKLPQSFYKEKKDKHLIPYGFAISFGFLGVLFNPKILFDMFFFLDLMPQSFF